MSERDEITTPEPDLAVEPAVHERAVVTPVRPRARGAGVAMLLALVALIAAGYALWQATVAGRGEDYARAELRQQVEALQARLTEAERRSGRSNELATTLRDQLTENERLHTRLREDLLAQAERSGRMEALLARLSRERGGADEQFALYETGSLLLQAQSRLELFGDRAGAIAALRLAEQTLARAGGGQGDLQVAVADAAAALAADARPSTSALLADLDAIAAALDAAPLRMERASSREGEPVGWWGRQFERVDRLVTIRRSDETDPVATPTKDAAHRALDRARLAALEQAHGQLPDLLNRARASLLACCEGDAIADAATRLQTLAEVNWSAAVPDLGALRQRLEQRAQIDWMPPPEPEPMPEPPADAAHLAEDEEDAA